LRLLVKESPQVDRLLLRSTIYSAVLTMKQVELEIGFRAAQAAAPFRNICGFPLQGGGIRSARMPHVPLAAGRQILRRPEGPIRQIPGKCPQLASGGQARRTRRQRLLHSQ
jgi:hypothetical protein